MTKGKFITFEGCDGSGKSTQIKILYNSLKKLGYKVQMTREPGGTETAEQIRNIHVANLDPITETFLLFAARREHFIKLIKPALEEGIILLCDRFYDSTIVYQGILKNVDIEMILNLKNITLGIPFEPDMTILLEVGYHDIKERLEGRKSVNTRDDYDSLPEESYDKITSAYRRLADIYSERYITISNRKNKKKVADSILENVTKLISNESTT